MDKRKKSDELIITHKELAFHNEEKGKRAAELIIATFLGNYSAYLPLGEKKYKTLFYLTIALQLLLQGV